AQSEGEIAQPPTGDFDGGISVFALPIAAQQRNADAGPGEQSRVTQQLNVVERGKAHACIISAGVPRATCGKSRGLNKNSIARTQRGRATHAIMAPIPRRGRRFAPRNAGGTKNMTLTIRDVQAQDLDSVLALNNAAGPTILPLDMAQLRALERDAAYFRVAEIDGHAAGFLIALREDADYASPNFRWFRERYAEFLYIDRIVVARPYRGLGLGRIFYADVTSFAEVR